MQLLDAIIKAGPGGHVFKTDDPHQKIQVIQNMDDQSVKFYDVLGMKVKHKTIGTLIVENRNNWKFDRLQEIYNIREAMREIEKKNDLVFTAQECDSFVETVMKFDDESKKPAIFLTFKDNDWDRLDEKRVIRKYVLPDEEDNLCTLLWRVRS